jgi:hypothetical protein
MSVFRRKIDNVKSVESGLLRAKMKVGFVVSSIVDISNFVMPSRQAHAFDADKLKATSNYDSHGTAKVSCARWKDLVGRGQSVADDDTQSLAA